MYTKKLEAAVTHSICTQLDNLGWVVDESSPENNVTQQRAKTEAQKQLLKEANGGVLKFPDFVLYEKGTTKPVGIIEAKRPGESLEKALCQATKRYAKPLNAPLVFAYNDTFVDARHLFQARRLKIDGEDVRQFVDHYTSLRFINEGPEILSAPQHVQISRDELIRIFKRQANFLREAGITAGLERFGVFSDVLFLKLMDELCQLREHSGVAPPLPPHLRWSDFQDRNPEDRLQYVRDVIWPAMNQEYGTIFSHAFPITKPEIFNDIVNDLSKFNFTGTDADVKGDAFEYFLKNAYQGIRIKDLGEYFTPRNIVRTMVSMVDPKFGEKIYDPFCGTGGFLIEAFRYISLRIKVEGERAEQLRRDTIYGTEIAATARVARMNMILFGDGHSNVVQNDSFANPKKEQYDVVLTNPPYSQNTRHGNLYPIPSGNGDAIAMQHCIRSLKPDGRAAVLVKEDFLTKGGDIGKAREYLFRSAKNLSIVSLPRRLFEPYTPTKTSVIYFEKNGTRDKTFFFVVQNVGHTFGARKKSIPENDLPQVLDSIRHPDEEPQIECHVIDNQNIAETDTSLWVYDYKEVLPPFDGPLDYLGEHIEESGEKFGPCDFPDENFRILGVSNQDGVFFNEEKLGVEIKQKYIRVKVGDLAYNPHRVNVGSLGLVSDEFDEGIVSGIYVVFRPKEASPITSPYLFHLLKSEIYLRIVRAYDTKHGAVRANLNWEQLQRIKIVVPSEDHMKEFMKRHEMIDDMKKNMRKMESELSSIVSNRS